MEIERIKLNINLPSGSRTSASVDLPLYEYFAVSLDLNPDEEGTQRKAEKWLEERLVNMSVRRVSGTVRLLMIFQIARPSLENKLQLLRS